MDRIELMELVRERQAGAVSRRDFLLRATAVLDTRCAGSGLTIPFARSVEAVEDNVLLEIDFIAAAQ